MPGPYLFALGVLVTIITGIAVALVGVLDVDDLSVDSEDDQAQ